MEIEINKTYVCRGGFLIGPMFEHDGDRDTLLRGDLRYSDGSLVHSSLPYLKKNGHCHVFEHEDDSKYHIVSKHYGDDEETRDRDGWKLNDFRRAVESIYYSSSRNVNPT